jgi:cephalosporin hydroxylase
MRLVIDTQARTVIAETAAGREEHPLDSPAAFRLITREWLAVGWTQRYSYSFTWLGRPLIQLPEDVLRIQEVIHTVKPDVIIETGVAHGGSLIFYASLCKSTDRGRVIGVDIEIRPHNRSAITAHPLARYITLIEGSSTDPATVEQVRQLISPGETVLVILDSNHSRDHVLAELTAYGPLVTPGSYIVATDGIMQDLAGRPGAKPEWTWDNPQEAARLFVKSNPGWQLADPPLLFNEGAITERVTYWPGAYLRRL